MFRLIVIELNFILLLILTAAPGWAKEISSVHFHSQEVHQIQLLNSGIASLEKRLQMIEEATETIQAEYFLWNKDRSGRIVLQALIDRAREGVDVQLLIDGSPLGRHIFDLEAEALRRAGGEHLKVRHYNRTLLANHRNHRKTLIVDGREALIGGRNIGDEYFDLSSSYNFLDRDIWLEGPIVSDVMASFERYWNSRLSSVETPYDGDYAGKQGVEMQRAEINSDLRRYTQAVLTAQPGDQELIAHVRRQGREALAKEFRGTCSDIRVVTHRPRRRYLSKWLGKLVRDAAAPGFSESQPGALDTEIMQVFEHFVEGTRESITAENPYFLPMDYSKNLLKRLILERGLKVRLLTNSAFSTDNRLIGAAAKSRIPSYTKMGLEISLYSGRPPFGLAPMVFGGAKARWGIHSKTFVFDQDDVAIGTFNFDPRSKEFNSEIMVFCNDQRDLALAVLYDIDRRERRSIRLGRDGKPAEGEYEDILFHLSPRERILIRLLELPAGYLDFLL